MALTFITLISCEKNSMDSNGAVDEDISAIQSVLEDSTGLFFDAINDGNEDNIMTDDPNWLSGGETMEKPALMMKTRFGRIGRRPVEHSIEIVKESDTTATAYIYLSLEGIFMVRKVEKNGDTLNFDRYEKTMKHNLERIVYLRKIDTTGNERRDWKIDKISMLNGMSEQSGVEIKEIIINASEQDSVVITNPLEYFQDGVNLFTYPRFTDVNITVKVENTTANPVVYPDGTEATEIVRLHFGRNMRGHFGRSEFRWVEKDASGYNVYKGKWTVKQFRGIHHAVIDVIDNGTVMEKDEAAYPYISNTWSTPYRVTFF